MVAKQQAIYDIKTDKFKYLKREQNRISNRVDVNELNKRLNKTKRSNFYITTLVSIVCLLGMISLILVSIKF
jgi:hypothetical protein